MDKDFSIEFIRGFNYIEDAIKQSIFEIGLEKTKLKALKGIKKLLKSNDKKDFVQGGQLAIQKFMERHGIKDE